MDITQPKPKTALCLAGGGARGALQAGYLKAFKELDKQYDVLFGASVGTLNGLLVHTDRIDQLEELWMKVRTKDVYHLNPLTVLTGLFFKKAVADPSPLGKLIEQYLYYDELQANPKHFYINATDYTNRVAFTKELHELNKDQLLKMVKASACPPIYFPLIEYEGLMLGDAGVVNNYAVTQAIRMGCDHIYLFTPTKFPQKVINTILDVLLTTIDIATQGYKQIEINCVRKINEILDEVNVDLEPDYRTINLTVVEPDRPINIDLLDFEYKGMDRRELIDYGYNLALNALRQEPHVFRIKI